MLKLSQNIKIAISALSVFVVSFSVMLFFLNGNEDNLKNMQTNIMHAEKTTNEQTTGAGNLEKNYRAKVDNSTDPLFILTADGNFVLLSEDFCKLLSKNCSELKNKSAFDYVNSKDLPELMADYSKVVSGEKLATEIGPFRMLNGKEEVYLMFKLTSVLGKDKKVNEIIVLVKDITGKIQDLDDQSSQSQSNQEIKEKNINNNWIQVLYPQIKKTIEDKKKLVFS